jgi:hypothetical protein
MDSNEYSNEIKGTAPPELTMELLDEMRAAEERGMIERVTGGVRWWIIPTDDEIQEAANAGSFPGEPVNEGFILGAKWVRDGCLPR